MKALVLVAVVACHSAEKRVSEVEVRADQRVELLSILQRLAGSAEYRTSPSTAYVRDVDTTFGVYANHAAVTATRELRARGIGHDAPMSLAIGLDDQFELRVRPDDPRFAGVDLDGYLASVRDFARTTGFSTFFTAHQPYYDKLAARLRTAIETEQPRAWFDTFFGKRAEDRFVVVPSPLAGTWNFGPHTEHERYQVMGIAKVDFDELPVVDADTLELVVHEMMHSYINPFVARHRAEFEPLGQRMFARTEEAMRKQAYGTWEIALDEALVRATTTLYLRDRKGAEAASAAARRELDRGFLFTLELAQALSDYARDRTRYRDLEAFLPELLGVLASLT